MMNLWWSATVAMAANSFCAENQYDLDMILGLGTVLMPN